MADKVFPSGEKSISVNLLPNFYKTDANRKFLQATVDQLVQPGTVKKINGFIGRQNSKSATGADIYVTAADATRQNYQLEPGFIVQNALGNTTFFKDYIDYINQLSVFGSNTSNHARLNKQEFYSWDPHIDWDKFVNFQNYYWLPFGPDTIEIFGQQLAIASTYTVTLQTAGADNQYVFTPDGATPNPILKLYRGQTYTFNITSAGNPFSIKTARTVGTTDRYTEGVSTNGVVSGSITFTVPNDAPSLLYYQSETDQPVGGQIEIFDITNDTYIDVAKDVLGKTTYTLPDGTALSNGMKVAFGGHVTPASYATGEYYVEGVGTSIKLINKSILEIVSNYTTSQAVLFDSTAFDIDPFSDSAGFAATKDYLLINRGSNDHNPWSRYNRWFHKDVISASAIYNKQTPSLDQAARAVRPIIEFNADLKLFNFGTHAITDVDVIDTYTTDVFSTIEGTAGYNVDGIALSQGQLVLFTADKDRLVKNNIYQVTFVNIQGFRQIHLVPVAEPALNQVALIKQGTKNQSQMYWYNGTTWQLAQQKTGVNQAPLFDVVDSNMMSFGDATAYPGTTFIGTSVFTYKPGVGTVDANLGFPLSYKNISNIGDIVFNFTLTTDTFQYKLPTTTALTAIAVKTGFLVSQDYAGNPIYQNGWQTCTAPHTQAAVRIYKNTTILNDFPLDIFDDINNLNDLVVRVYVDGYRVDPTLWTLVDSTVYKNIHFTNPPLPTQIVTIKAYAAQSINGNGYYEIPVNLQNNPLNAEIGDFTLGEVLDHVSSIVDNLTAFVGAYPGDGNLRDLGNVTQYGTKFVQHSGPASLSVYHVTNETNNIVRAIEKNREDYNNFKRNFIAIAETLGVDSSAASQVDLILDTINKNKPSNFPYYFSDMVPYGAAHKTTLTVVDYRVKAYPLTNVFSLDALSTKAVGIYLNSSQLLYGRDYGFNSQGFVVINNSVKMVNGDTITTVEYDSTDGSFVPETPTKLGMWPKFEPKIYLDTSLVTPTLMIQGHDGSQIAAYNDYRDNIILELESRIFNNIKVTYDPLVYNVADIIPGYNRTTDYTLTEFNATLAPSFYKWATLIDKDFTKPLQFDGNNSFTFNYLGHSAPNGTTVPGYWRGIYRYILDTDRPNIAPWEMLGLSIEPSWWTTVYGPAPYTSDNRVMWQDIADGMLRAPGVPAVKQSQYAKPFLMQHLPVDQSGNLISPLESGLAQGTVTYDVRATDYVFGDIGPVEAAWRRSSHYPYSVILTSMLLTPAKTFGTLLDRSRVVRNIAGQLVYSTTGLRITPVDILLPSISTSTIRVQTAGILNFLINYILSDNLKSYTSYQYDLDYLSAQLTYRVGAFTSKEKFKLMLDSRTYTGASSVFVPQEDYSIVLNSSSPIKKITYSGVIITKMTDSSADSYEVKGYSQSSPYFKYYNYVQSGANINVGGISESFTTWAPATQYGAGTVVKYNGGYYRVVSTHVSTTVFDKTFYQALGSLPIVGGANAILRKAWDRTTPVTVPYGTRFSTVQAVVDFLTGYGEWLKDQGFLFDEFNPNLSSVSNWETSSKEFMFWTTQNWSGGQDQWTDWLPTLTIKFGDIVRYSGDYYRATNNIPPSPTFDPASYAKLDSLSIVGNSVISLSPSASKITFNTTLSVVDDITNAFNGYEIFRVDGTPLASEFINSYRQDNAVTYAPRTEDGIYGASFYLVQKEQVVILNNYTMFNDVIYSPATGYKQDRIKTSGYVSIDWYGGFDVPGFIFDEAIVNEWTAWTNYHLGDIVKYKQFFYAADAFLPGSETFVSSNWIKLDKAPSSALLPNWSYKAGQFTDFYSLDSDNFDATQQKVAQHLIGYQKRNYLDNIIQDDVSEFKFYQGMIREKGTQNVLNKLFDVLSSENKESITFFEEWALRLGQYGANGAFENIEFILEETQFKNNPQGFLLVNQPDTTAYDFIIRQTPNDVYLKPLGYNSSPWPALTSYQPYLRSAGYVRASDVFVSLGQLSEIANYDITKFTNGAYVWVAFENKPTDWNVYRFSDIHMIVTNVTYDGTTLTITARDDIKLKVGSWVGISQTTQINGFYQIASVSLNSFTALATISGFTNFADQGAVTVSALTSQRTSTIDNIDSVIPLKLASGEILWTDDAGTGTWASWIYNPVYTQTGIINTNPAAQLTYGNFVAINQVGNILGITTANGQVITWDKASNKTAWIQREVIQQPFISAPVHANLATNIATVVAFSTDGNWMATGSPNIGYAYSRYLGAYNSSIGYALGDIVSIAVGTSNNGSIYFYQALQAMTANHAPAIGYVSNAYWESIPYAPISTSGTTSNLIAQGAIHLYKKDTNNLYTLVDSIISPRPQASELFGASLQFFVPTTNSSSAQLLVGAPGSSSLYDFQYGTVTEASSAYNPVGSSSGTIVVTSTAGILPGMTVTGTGFISGQTVLTVVNSTTLLLSGSPDSTPSGTLTFSVSGWFSAGWTNGQTLGLASGSGYGAAITASGDGMSAIAVSAVNSTHVGQVVVEGNNISGIFQIITGTTATFGASVAVSNDGTYVAIGDSLATTGGVVNQGAVTVYKLINGVYSVYQHITNHAPQSSGAFGSKVAFMGDKTLVIYSASGDTIIDTTFDTGLTSFDKNTTGFITSHLDSGRVDIYDNYATKWVFAESLSSTSITSDAYGSGFAVGANHVIIGAPLAIDQGYTSGLVYDYHKTQGTYTWSVNHADIVKSDISKIKRAFLYNKSTGELVTHLDVIDPSQGKIAGPAAEEITYTAFYDPAMYSVGDSTVNVNAGIAWAKSQVGKLWWDLRTAKFINSYDNDPVYRNSSLNTLAAGASIDVYEWVATSYLPSAWNAVADTEAGLALGISGTSLYGNTVYSISQVYDTVSQSFKNTYYYWVKNKKTIPTVDGRNMSASDAALLIANPRGQGYTYLALTGLNSFSLVNAKSTLSNTDVVLSVEYWTTDKTDQNVHSQWKIINDDILTVLPTTIELKWVDSLCGRDLNDKPVPDMNQPAKLRYGIENRPRQSMFVNRFEALKQVVEQSNITLAANQIVSSKNLTALNQFDTYPSTITGEYDTTSDTDAELSYVSVGAFRRPSVTPIITDGKITGITILYAGAGYLHAPYITITGSGVNAVVRAVINSAGQITGATIINSGEGYNGNTVTTIRDYSVLVYADSQAEGAWSIYSYDPTYKVWSRIRSKTFDVTKYWTYANWFAAGYSQFSAADYAVSTLAELNTIDPNIGHLVLVRSTGTGGWQLLKRFAVSNSIDWTQSYSVVGIENGTIQLSSNLYAFANTNIGYDNSTFDGAVFDGVASIELRIILTALKDDIFTNDLKQSYLDLFFTSVRYALSEQTYLDWIFKTSFVKATHNVGDLNQPVTFQTDNLANFQSYIDEVKPYRTQIREYVSAYSKVDNTSTMISDFDLPPAYENGMIVPVVANVSNGQIVSSDTSLQSYPWKNWFDNVGFTVTELRLVNGGSGYISEPVVTIVSDSGTGATARAFFSNGVINRIVLLTQGSGYLSAPTVVFNGGLSATGVAATAVAVIGNGVVRSSLIKIKFDRLTQTYYMTQLQQTETFTGTGSLQQFPLVWAPDVRVGQSSVTVNGIPVLRELYTLSTNTSTSKGYTSYSGLIKFTTAPAIGAAISVTYIKDWSLLNAADRTKFYYTPLSGEIGNDLAQLMTGIDYGGVIVNGLGFDVAAGWGALPYYSDKWDTFDATFNDYIVTIAAGTRTFTLPYVPAAGTVLNVYYIHKNVQTYPGDGVTLTYSYSFSEINPIITVSRTTTSTAAGLNLNTAGATVIGIVSTTGIVVGDTVTCASSTAFAYGVVVTAINAVTNHITVSQILYATLATGSNIVFTRTLSQPADVTVFANGTIKLKSAVIVGSQLAITGQATPVRIDDPYYTSTITTDDGGSAGSNSPSSIVDDGTAGSVSGSAADGGSATVYTTASISPETIEDGGTANTTLINGVLDDGSANNYYGINDSVADAGSAYSINAVYNNNAVMVTPVADGTTATVVTIPGSYPAADGDQFIIRQSTSDGSIKPQDADYDTALTGGDLAYSTATGLNADDILVDGDGFVTPTSSPAPEEVVPGQVVDTVAIKVFDQPQSGSANIKVDNYVADGITSAFTISQTPSSPRAIIVKQGTTILTYGTQYSVDYVNKLVTLVNMPALNQVISIFSLGFNGANILDLDYFIADGSTVEFVTKAPWLDSVTSLVYNNGIASNAVLFKTDSTYTSPNRIGLRFSSAPAAGAVINYIIVSGSQQTFAVTKTETVLTNGALTYALQYPIGNNLPLESSMIVRVDQNILAAPNNSYYDIANGQLKYTIDPTKFIPYSVPIGNLVVLANGVRLTLGTDYIVDLGGITVTLNQVTYTTYAGTKLVISVTSNQGYAYNSTTGQITFAQAYDNTHTVEVISSYKHDILDIQRTAVNVTSNLALTADTVQYFYYKSIAGGIIALDRTVLDDGYVWVIKNTTLLTPAIDYKLNNDKRSITLATMPTVNDQFTLMTFSSNVLTSGIAYMQFKDMLNRVVFKRLSLNKRTYLTAALHWNDTTITVADTSKFDAPNPAQNKPGIIEIRGERIEFFAIDGNVLSRLRRGTLGTGTPTVHNVNSWVQEIGPRETMPYNDTIVTEQIVSDGTNFVTTTFVPTKSNTFTYAHSYTSSIPAGYGQSNDVEVFVGGYDTSTQWTANTVFTVGEIVTLGSYTYKCVTAHTSSGSFTADSTYWTFFIGNIRLKKKPYTVHNVNNAPNSPEGDVQLDADFAVDGTSKQIRLTNALAVGTHVTVVKRTGIVWDSTTSILTDNTNIGKFLRATPGIWYEDQKQS
jgi:hypothetical protein